MGRSFAMDRDQNWDHTESAYRTMTGIAPVKIEDPIAHISSEYAKGVTDEYITPAAIGDDRFIRENDAIVFFNFREDGLRQLTRAFAEPDFTKFSRTPISNLYLVTFTEYEKGLPVSVAFPAPEITNCLSEILSRQGVKQMKIAESQKYAHVTYFFNGGREEPFPFENRTIFPSLVAQDSAEFPEMRADDIGQEVVRAMERTASELIVVNFANADSVAHTGNYQATIRAVEAVDRAIDRIYQSVAHRKGALLITADHGGAEELFNSRTGEVRTGHSSNPVPLYFVTSRNRLRAMRTEEEIQQRFSQPMGVLADIAPTILELLSVKKPEEMTGRSLLGLL
jgi:2,3-bisphosphoglycerate-independent phosphoglycerate mutase